MGGEYIRNIRIGRMLTGLSLKIVITFHSDTHHDFRFERQFLDVDSLVLADF